MLISEFIDRTGFRPTEDYYHTEIEPEYNRSNLDKDAWCKQWKKNGGIQKAYDAMCKAAHNQALRVNGLESNVDAKTKEIADLRKKFEDVKERLFEKEQLMNTTQESENAMMETLIEISETYSARELRDLIIGKIGFKAYISYKFEHDKAIWKVDREDIVKSLVG